MCSSIKIIKIKKFLIKFTFIFNRKQDMSIKIIFFGIMNNNYNELP